MKPVNDLRDLLLEQLKDRFDAEHQQLEAFPKLLAEATSPSLKRAIEVSLGYSRNHIRQLEHIFKQLHEDPIGELCEGTIGLITETWRTLDKCQESALKDVAIIIAIQHIHHHDIAGYGSLCALSLAQELDQVAKTLHDMLEQEKQLDQLLIEISRERLKEAYYPSDVELDE